MRPPCPPGWRSTHGPQLWPGARGGHSPGLVLDGGPPGVGSCRWAGASRPTAPAQGRVQQLLSTDPTQQTAGAPPAPGTPKGLGTPPSLGCSPQTPHSPRGEPGPSTVAPQPPRGKMRVRPSQAPCLLPPGRPLPCGTMELGGGSPGTARSPSVRGALGPPCCTWHPGGSCSALQCQGHPGPLQAVHRCFQCGRSCTPDSRGGCTLQRPPCFPGAVASWAGLARGPCALLLVAGGSCSPGTGPLEPWDRAVGLQAGTKRQWRHRGCSCVHACPCVGTCVSWDWGTCAAHGGLVSRPGLTPTPRGAPCPTLHLGTFS